MINGTPDILFFDTETTGLSAARGDKVVEIAIVDINGSVLLDTLVNPLRKIPTAASSVHGISNEMVLEAPSWVELLSEIQQIIKGKTIVAYNADYDGSFFPDHFFDSASLVCAMQKFRSHVGAKRSLSLNRAVKICGHVWSGDAHRALADTMACRAVWQWIEENPEPTIDFERTFPGKKSSGKKSAGEKRQSKYRDYATADRSDLPWATWEKFKLKTMLRNSTKQPLMIKRLRRPWKQISEQIEILKNDTAREKAL